MCGIVVALGEPPTEKERQKAIAALRHRGPDDEGRFEEADLFIGHTRLAILDVTDAARQPMISPDDRYVLAYNGEIYNYLELRAGLRRIDWEWRGTGDTEVLLALLATEGDACLPKLRGMFAFAFWDRETRTLLCARDPLGIKPLVYGHDARGTVVASEMRALEAIERTARVDAEAVRSFLLTGSVVAPRTILEGVRRLPPGCLLRVREGSAEEFPYWELPAPSGQSLPEAQMLHELDDLLEETVRLHLRSDVPVGTFLSGGIDSSLVTAYAARELGDDLRTFSVGFEVEDPRWDETAFAKAAADSLGTRHQRVHVSRSDFVRQMSDVVRALDQPSVDGVNSYFVSQAAAPEVKVALSGQGGDEFFAGYNVFQLAARVESLSRRLSFVPRTPRLARQALRLPARVQHNWYVRGALSFLASADPDLVYAMSNPLFAASEVGLPVRLASASHRDGDLVDALSRRLIRGYLADTLLRDMDATSMSHSLEVRLPLVDQVLAAFALAIPSAEKVLWGRSKRPLRALAERRLPRDVVTRRKQGFNFPLAEWLRHPDALRRIKETLAPDLVRDAGFVPWSLVAHELSALEHPRQMDLAWLRAQRVWALYVLHEWNDMRRARRA